MEYGGSEIMLASPGNDYRSPGRLGGATVIVHMYVDDIQAHCQRARDAGATIRREPKEKPYGTIQYAAVDPEGHVWLFSQQVRDPEPSGWLRLSEAIASGPWQPPGIGVCSGDIPEGWPRSPP
jgi:hypothetical protein